MKIERSPKVDHNGNPSTLPPFRLILQDGYEYHDTLEAAIRSAKGHSHPGDIIVVPAGCSITQSSQINYCPYCGHKL